jgi:DNA polymerase-3 subunit delta
LLYVFHGEDGFSASEAVARLLDAVGPPDLRESNVTHLDAREFTIDRFGAAAMVVPFLADRRVVVIRGLLGAAEGGRTGRRGRRPAAAAQDKGPAAGLVPLLTELPPTTDVVFVDGKLNAGNQVLAAIKELGPEQVVIREFAPMRRDSLVTWVRDRASRKGATIEQTAVAELTELVGANLWTMDQELEKLAIYCAGRPITPDDVHALVTGSRESSVFELVDAIMARRPQAALEVMERLLEGGATGPSLIAIVARQARMVAIAQELGAANVPRSEWGSRIGTTSDFVVRKTSDQARRFSPEAVRGLYRLLLNADMAMKTGETTDELALTELVAQAGSLSGAPSSGR